VSYVLLGCARNIWWLLASRMLAGFMAGNIAAAFAYASDVSAPQKRAATLGLIGAAIGTGFALGPPLGGVLAGKDPPALISWHRRGIDLPERVGDRAGEMGAPGESHRRAPAPARR